MICRDSPPFPELMCTFSCIYTQKIYYICKGKHLLNCVTFHVNLNKDLLLKKNNNNLDLDIITQ